MNSCDVIGYAYDGAIFCADCKPDVSEDCLTPIFPDYETDSPSHCESCDAYIPETLTSDGVEYVLTEALALERASEIIGGYGESCCISLRNASGRRAYLSYVNMGETYAVTLCVGHGAWIGSWGDWVEQMERRGYYD